MAHTSRLVSVPRDSRNRELRVLYKNVTRATRLRLLARDRAGAALEFEMEGFEARVVRYELDHLDGMLFVDRLVSRRTDLFRR
ncbi:peptide deformylase [Candidatus Thiosymbion oneisti]|uniref:peptide deformylase n=1 Tax=Candidatus Thiosymbion oneisti TaxID=589554 RepID=UPI00210C980C|nr:peptide deformylase [Candidatus Thiosymbion oneisti]